MRRDDAYDPRDPEPVGDDHVDNNNRQSSYHSPNHDSDCNLDYVERVDLFDNCRNRPCSHSGGYHADRTVEH